MFMSSLSGVEVNQSCTFIQKIDVTEFRHPKGFAANHPYSFICLKDREKLWFLT